MFFTGTAVGETMSKTFASVSAATKLRLSMPAGGNGWAFWRIRFGGITILESPDGAVQPPYLTGTRFWIDGEATQGQTIPASIEIDVQCTFGPRAHRRRHCHPSAFVR